MPSSSSLPFTYPRSDFGPIGPLMELHPVTAARHTCLATLRRAYTHDKRPSRICPLMVQEAAALHIVELTCDFHSHLAFDIVLCPKGGPSLRTPRKPSQPARASCHHPTPFLPCPLPKGPCLESHLSIGPRAIENNADNDQLLRQSWPSARHRPHPAQKACIIAVQPPILGENFHPVVTRQPSCRQVRHEKNHSSLP